MGDMHKLLAVGETWTWRSPQVAKSLVMMTGAASEGRPCHIDRRRKPAVHYEPVLYGAGPSMSATAHPPCCSIESGPSTGSADEATAEVWMLHQDYDKARFWKGSKKRPKGRTYGSMWPSPFRLWRVEAFLFSRGQ
jgi:hypothetical protein